VKRIAIVAAAAIAATVLITRCYFAVLALVHGSPELVGESYRNSASWQAFRDALIAMIKVVFVPAIVGIAFAEIGQKQNLLFYLGAGLLGALVIYAVNVLRSDLPLNFRTAYLSVHMLVLGVIWGITYWLMAGRSAGLAR
jgi:hypothetical protein